MFNFKAHLGGTIPLNARSSAVPFHWPGNQTDPAMTRRSQMANNELRATAVVNDDADGIRTAGA